MTDLGDLIGHTIKKVESGTIVEPEGGRDFLRITTDNGVLLVVAMDESQLKMLLVTVPGNS